ncbi:MAG: prepilin-type N-terminal cleavage/methylation domain-containing protein [Gracilibacteraceae bacterium]|jgi:prepilin-type N-terminal cleavage/methylation domain-containing protein|nr:prepilin-type N-terminal cleavage/methylation domain-containing protein [Gracilibacteraceae bacterium]
MRFLARKQDGFTLVEMITALVLMGIVSVGLVSFIHYMYDSYKRSETLWIEEQAVHKVAQAIYDLTDISFQAEILNSMSSIPKDKDGDTQYNRNTFYIFGDSSNTSSPRLTALDAVGNYVKVDTVELNGVYFEPKEQYPMDMVFTPAKDADGKTLKQAMTFTLTGRKADFSLDTTVYFPNMNDNQQLGGVSSGRVLAFQTWGDKIVMNLKSIIVEMPSITCCSRY